MITIHQHLRQTDIYTDKRTDRRTNVIHVAYARHASYARRAENAALSVWVWMLTGVAQIITAAHRDL